MCENDRIRAMLDTVIAHLNDHELRFAVRDERPHIIMSISCQNGTYPIVISVEQGIFGVFAHFGSHVPPQRRVAVAELLNRINYTLISGCFEMDFNDGEIRFRNTMDLRGGELTDGIVGSGLGTSLSTMERFAPALTSVMSNDVAPEDAMAFVLDNPPRREAS